MNHTTSTDPDLEPDVCRCLGLWIRRSIRLLELSENTPPELAALLQTLLAAERMLEQAEPQCLQPPADRVQLREWFRNRNLNALDRGELVDKLVESEKSCVQLAQELGISRRWVHHLLRVSKTSHDVKREVLLKAVSESRIRALVQEGGNGRVHTSETGRQDSKA